MKKAMKFLVLCDVLIILVICGMLMADKQTLSTQVVRLHVVGNSNTAEDQAVKIKVKDAVVASLQPKIAQLKTTQDVKQYLQENLDSIRLTADQTLQREGIDLQSNVTFAKETFPVRHYDTFSLPSGVYESLRITIGEGEGRNWWCVVFPSLCMQASSENLVDCAVGAGFSDRLVSTVTEKPGYEIGFFFLDCLGKLENLFFIKS